MQPYAPPDTDFAVPYMMGGPKPKPAAAPGQVSSPGSASRDPTGVELPPLPTAAPRWQRRTPRLATSAPPTAAANGAAPTAKAATKPASKPLKLDPALLERALMNRYTTPQ